MARNLRRPFLRFCALLLALILATPDLARAQDPFSAFFEGLFGGGGSRHAERYAPRERPSQARRYMPHLASRPQAITRPSYGAPHSSRGGQGKPAVKPPGTETFFVAVLGDTLGLLLTTGLENAFDSTPQIGFRHRAKENSGLVRDDFYDWVKASKDIAAEQPKPDIAILMIGGNDRQPLAENGQTLEPLSPRWRELYAARLQAVFAAFKEKGIPFIMVGLPVMKGEKYSADMAQINDIYRAEAEKAGAIFVDIWDKFADERGQYSVFGPDVNGEIVKLRLADGVHFTEAGARKLAHFVEADIKKIYEARLPPEQAPAEGATAPAQPAAAPTAAANAAAAPSDPALHAPGEAPGIELPPAAPKLPDARPAIGAKQQLTSFAPGSDELAARANSARRAGAEDSPERALAKHVLIEGGDQPARRGRADDFSYRAAPEPAR
ncbi:MAG TPA: SGNH family hydrolase [Methylocystis sp.]|nr:SGNH family hydrolase [Methylocystis sp.]